MGQALHAMKYPHDSLRLKLENDCAEVSGKKLKRFRV